MNNPWDELKGAPPSSSVTSKPVESAMTNTTAPPSAPFSTDAIASSAKTGESRGGAVVILVIGIGLTAFNWWMALTQYEYYVKAALLGPFCAVVGAVGLFAPQTINDKNAVGKDKALRFTAMALGAVAGGLNWYLLAN